MILAASRSIKTQATALEVKLAMLVVTTVLEAKIRTAKVTRAMACQLRHLMINIHPRLPPLVPLAGSSPPLAVRAQLAA